MVNVRINNNFVFTPAANAQIADLNANFSGLPIPLPQLLFHGDLVAFDNIGPFTFVVVQRKLRFRSESELDATYLLDLPTRIHRYIYDWSIQL